jgi:simple sugar transport system permease protein
VATAAGLSVLGLRYVAVTVACVFAALGGGALTVISTGSFNIDITSGQGFIALAIVILGRWNPLLIILGAWLFGLADALQFQLVTVPSLSGVPHDVWLAAPYVITILVVVFSRGARYPAATGVPFTPVRKPRRLLAWISS